MRWASTFRISAIVLGGGASFLLGIKHIAEVPAWLPDAAFGLTLAVTVIGSIDAFFDPKPIWVLYAGSVRRLDYLLTRLAPIKVVLNGEFADADGADVKKMRDEAIKQLQEIQDEFSKIVASLVSDWVSIRSEPDSK